jgi:hypothetical protein
MNSQKPSYLGEGGRALGGLGGGLLAAAPPPLAPRSLHDEPAEACGMRAQAGRVAAAGVLCARAGVL